MYRFMTEAFGACNVRRRKKRSDGAALLEIIEIETFHGSSSIVSRYRFERRGSLSRDSTHQSEVGLCRYAIAQFFLRNEAIHVASVGILDVTLPKFRGKLTAIPDDNNGLGERCSHLGAALNCGSQT